MAYNSLQWPTWPRLYLGLHSSFPEHKSVAAASSTAKLTLILDYHTPQRAFGVTQKSSPQKLCFPTQHDFNFKLAIFTPPTLSFLTEYLTSCFIQKIENTEWKLHLPTTKSRKLSSFALITVMSPPVTMEASVSTGALNPISPCSRTRFLVLSSKSLLLPLTTSTAMRTHPYTSFWNVVF